MYLSSISCFILVFHYLSDLSGTLFDFSGYPFMAETLLYCYCYFCVTTFQTRYIGSFQFTTQSQLLDHSMLCPLEPAPSKSH